MFRFHKWTDFNAPPREVFNEAIAYLHRQLAGDGFTQRKNKRLIMKSMESDFEFILDFGTQRGNQKGVTVHFNVHFLVQSESLQSWRSELYQSNDWETDKLVTHIGLGYLTKDNDYSSGTWNLLQTHPKTIAKTIRKYAIPAFDLFNDPPSLIAEIRQGKPKAFCFEFQALDFLMCFGGEQHFEEALSNMLKQRQWTDIFKNRLEDLKQGKDIKPDLISLLVKRAHYVGTQLDPKT